jgi:hypothetical protein
VGIEMPMVPLSWADATDVAPMAASATVANTALKIARFI